MRQPMWRFLRAITSAILVVPALVRAEAIDWQHVSDEALEHLQAYIRVDTSNPPGNETAAAELLRSWLAAEGIDARFYDAMNNPARQALVARLPGRSGRSVVLMSHSDVVPAVSAEWSHPPFAADIANGNVYGRGTLDTKGLGILQLMTLVMLHRQAIVPHDDVLLLIEPDEEEDGAGVKGMLERFPEVFGNVRMVLNEGASGMRDLFKPGQVVMFVQTAEKGIAWMRLRAHGDAGHGSVPLRNNAVITMARALDRIAAYQTPLRPAPPVLRLFAALADQQPFPISFAMRHIDNPIVQTLFHRQLTARPQADAMLRTTISLTGMHGGYKTNVIPAETEATLDCRVTVGDSGEALKREIERVVNDPRVEIDLLQNGTPNESPINEQLMDAVRTSTVAHYPGALVAPLMSTGVTDSAHFRRRNIPAYGFSPLILTETDVASVHGIDERVSIASFRTAVQIYFDVVTKLTAAGTSKREP